MRTPSPRFHSVERSSEREEVCYVAVVTAAIRYSSDSLTGLVATTTSAARRIAPSGGSSFIQMR